MGKLKWHIILVIALWLVFCGMASAVELHVGSGQTYSTIRGAVDAAGDGDVIIVHAGSYTEHVSVAKRLTLLGEGADVVTVTAAVTSEHIFYVAADYVNISGFTVTGATGYYSISGIYLDNVEHCNISDNNASNNDYGIYLQHSSSNTLENNTVNSNDHCGIRMSSSDNNNLANNTASDNSCGIYQVDSSSNVLTENIANSNNNYGIYLQHSSSNTLENNTVNSNNDSGIYLYYYSSNNNIIGNTASNNSDNDEGIGIYVGYSDNNNLEKNTMNLNNYGIHLHYSRNNDITCNLVHKNSDSGFCLTDSSTDNIIEHNNIVENGNYNSTSGGWEWDFYNDQGCIVEARNNYWGTPDNDIVDASIYDDDESTNVYRLVRFYPPAGEPVPCAPIPIPELHGDVNHDGKLSTTDAVLALQMAVGGIDTDLAADMNSDGKITSLDALMILQAAAENI